VIVSSTETISLPFPPSRTVQGPVVKLAPAELDVLYDYETDDGTVKWVRLRFRSVLEFEYRGEACCLETDLEAYQQMLKLTDSPRLASVRERYMRHLRGVAAEEESTRFVHFRLYFDDSGGIEVVAQSLEIEEVTAPMS